MLNARLGYSNSFSWRTIWSAKNLVKEGILWRVGNGRAINIWRDPWVGDERGRFITSVESSDLNVVTDLINAETMEWRYNVLVRYFNERDRDCILAIPLSSVEETMSLCGLTK